MFDHYHPRIYRYALGKLRKPSDAEDVAAETFSRVLRDLDRFKWRGGGFEAWLFRIASNLVVDTVRRSGRETADENVEDKATAWLESPESDVLRLETRGELTEMLDRLVPEQREVLLLRFAAGLDPGEAGAIMGKNSNAIRQLQFRALGNLRKMMTPEEV